MRLPHCMSGGTYYVEVHKHWTGEWRVRLHFANDLATDVDEYPIDSIDGREAIKYANRYWAYVMSGWCVPPPIDYGYPKEAV